MRILITGTTGGIGGAVEKAAAKRGWETASINRGGFDAPLEGTFDAVVFATGTCPVKPLTVMSDDEFAGTIEVNCGLFVRLMRKLVSGRHYALSGMKAVAISSVSAVEGWAGGSAYCASKGALSAVCRAFDAELKALGISVTALEPRYVRTRMFENGAGRMGVDPSLARDPMEFAEEILSSLTGRQDHDNG